MTRAVDFKPTFGAFILETLTLGMYGETRIAIREYVQNAFDSLQEAINSGLLTQEQAIVDVHLQGDKGLVIRDNGVGIRTENAVAVLASVGASSKRYSKDAGFRGIGRLAGIVFCNRLIFSTKAVDQTERTVVEIDAKLLREMLAPESGNVLDAAQSLAACVQARVEDSGEEADVHYFEVRLEGYHEPPPEATDLAALKSFLQQVSPLPYSPAFPFADKIRAYARDTAGAPLETIRVFVADETTSAEEIFKPYQAQYLVKNKKIALSDVDFVKSESNKYWGWIGRKKTSGAIKDIESRGIRVRMKNIQIDDVNIMREIFAVPTKKGAQQRQSYIRFAEWYVGEIHVSTSAAVPNARRDGFEESDDWKAVRGELEEVALRYGRLAYKTSKGDQLSLENIQRLYSNLKTTVEGVAPGNWDKLSVNAAAAVGILQRIAQAVMVADEAEGEELRKLHAATLELKAQIQDLTTDGPETHDCEAEIEQARSDLTQEIYTILRSRLGPAEWRLALHAIQKHTGEKPK